MWGRKRPDKSEPAEAGAPPHSLRAALRTARVESAERTGVVVDLHDAELARLELLNEALDPVFEEIPADVDLFDRGISRGETPRLWIDSIAHVAMGHDKRIYRFVQDSRNGRKVLAEAQHIPEMAQAITRYLANRLIERDRAMASAEPPALRDARGGAGFGLRRAPRRRLAAFLLGIVVGICGLAGALLLAATRQGLH